MGQKINECRVCGELTTKARQCYRRNQLVKVEQDTFVDETLWFCEHCGFRWIDPPPPLEKLLENYRDTPLDHWSDPTTGGEGSARRYNEKVEQILSFVSGGKALDVGCFNGDFLSYLPSTFEKWGVEVSRSAATLARKRGITVIESDILNAKLPAQEFDLIYCSDVFEHLTEQRELATALSRSLAPNGLLVIETGDCSSPLAQMMGARWYYQGLMEHVCFHTGQSLNLLMEQVDLAPRVTERRWHEPPANLLRPVRRAGMALGYHAAMSVLGWVRGQIRLPDYAEQLYSRTAPRHPWRDHLWHFYTHNNES